MKTLFLTLLVGFTQIATAFDLREGDLLFQDLDCGPMCDAIEEVTDGHDRHRFSHVGIVARDETGGWEVIEAIAPDVHATELKKFLARSLDKAKKPKVGVGRLQDYAKDLREKAIAYARAKVGTPYDGEFAMGEKRLYCSELTHYAFRDGEDEAIFPTAPMTFKPPGSDDFYPVWKNYFKQLKLAVPEGKEGLNPGAMSRHPKIKMYYPYGEISKKEPKKD